MRSQNRNNELSEEELQKQREAFVTMLMAKKSNFELNHRRNKG